MGCSLLLGSCLQQCMGFARSLPPHGGEGAGGERAGDKDRDGAHAALGTHGHIPSTPTPAHLGARAGRSRPRPRLLFNSAAPPGPPRVPRPSPGPSQPKKEPLSPQPPLAGARRRGGG